MDAPPKFVLRMDGLEPENLIQIQGEKGPFYVCISGSSPELRNGCFYGDDRYQFCFFTKFIFDRQKTDQPVPYDIDVYYATAGRVTGGLPKIPKKDVEYIERNITHLWRTRRVTHPGMPVNPNDAPREIRFTWRISK